MDSVEAGRHASAQLRRVGWFLHASLVETKLRALERAAKAKFDPNQPRVPAGNPDGGQWTGTGESTEFGIPRAWSADDSIQLAADITGFTKHGINRAISRGISPSAIHGAVVNPIQILPQADGSTRYVDAGAVVVLDPLGRVITVWGQ